MSVSSLVEVVNLEINNLKKKFQEIEQEYESIKLQYSEELKQITERYSLQRQEINNEKDDILTYYRIASNNTTRTLITVGVTPIAPDFDELNRLFNSRNGAASNDYASSQIVDLVGHYLAYYDAILNQIDQDELIQKQTLRNKVNADVNALKKKREDYAIKCRRNIEDLRDEKLIAKMNLIDQKFNITYERLLNWEEAKMMSRKMMTGYMLYPIVVPKYYIPSMNITFGDLYNHESSSIKKPYGYNIHASHMFLVEYTDFNEGDLKAGIQNIVLNYLFNCPLSTIKVSVFDNIYFNAEILGPLREFTNVKDGTIDIVPSTKKQLDAQIQLLEDYYKKEVLPIIGNLTVAQYNENKKDGNIIPYRVLIINQMSERHYSFDTHSLDYLINNSERFGITVFQLKKDMTGGSKNTKKESEKLWKDAEKFTRIISDSQGRFYVDQENEWYPYVWNIAPQILPEAFISKVSKLMAPKTIGTYYFDRFQGGLPKKSAGQRRRIKIPFGVTKDDKTFYCEMEDENFAAYLTGTSGSGKSTLLHTLICGLVMNYHPDEVELWMLDPKLMEFRRYFQSFPPHIKYLLVDNSRNMIFDYLDRINEEYNRRIRIFKKNGWSNHQNDVPISVYMPALFFIIDEFDIISQVIKETRGEEQDYTLLLQNMLSKGRAVGFHFIFASQRFTTGVSGLTEYAKSQIGIRFAMKNEYAEIKEALNASAEELTSEISMRMHNLPVYETIYKWKEKGQDRYRYDWVRNMFTKPGDNENMIKYINEHLFSVSEMSDEQNNSYVFKSPVIIDGGVPKQLDVEIPAYEEFEYSVRNNMEDTEYLVFPGAACSLNPTEPIYLMNNTAENIFLIGGKTDDRANIVQSVKKTYMKLWNSVEVWTSSSSDLYRRYKEVLFNDCGVYTKREELCLRISDLKKMITSGAEDSKLIIVIGYEKFYDEFELFANEISTTNEAVTNNSGIKVETFTELEKQLEEETDPEIKRALIEKYNQLTVKYNDGYGNGINSTNNTSYYDARSDLMWILKRASNQGIHFFFVFGHANDFGMCKMDPALFNHRMSFKVTKEMTYDLGIKNADTIEDAGIFMYFRKQAVLLGQRELKSEVSYRPHIYKEIGYEGWMISDAGEVIENVF